MNFRFATRTALEWERIFITYKVTGCATRTTTEWLNSEHALASGLVIERPSPHLPHGELMKEAGPLVWHNPTKTCVQNICTSFFGVSVLDITLTVLVVIIVGMLFYGLFLF